MTKTVTESDRMVIRLKWLFDNYRLKLTDCELRSRPMVLLWIVCFFCKKIIPLYLRDIIFNNFKFSVNFWCKILNVETKFQRWKTRNRLWLALSFCYNIQNNLIEVLMGMGGYGYMVHCSIQLLDEACYTSQFNKTYTFFR